jgi:plasmid stabilization system protein ParE
MTIVESELFKQELSAIVHRIHRDKPTVAREFTQKLADQIRTLPESPLRCRRSYYFDDDAIRDMIFRGYTVIYNIEPDTLTLITIFNQNLPVIT